MLLPLLLLIQTTAAPAFPPAGDDKRVILYGVGAILTAMASAFALLWRAYQSQIEARQADYKDVIVVLQAIKVQGEKIMDKFDDISDTFREINRKLDDLLNKRGQR